MCRILVFFSGYSCALVADILLQGHLYVTENYFAFYSNVFGYVTKVPLPCTHPFPKHLPGASQEFVGFLAQSF